MLKIFFDWNLLKDFMTQQNFSKNFMTQQNKHKKFHAPEFPSAPGSLYFMSGPLKHSTMVGENFLISIFETAKNALKTLHHDWKKFWNFPI